MLLNGIVHLSCRGSAISLCAMLCQPCGRMCAMQLIGQHGDSRNAVTGENEQAAALVAIDAIISRILVVRGQKVMLDLDLAALYGVTTKRLNELM